MKLKDIKPGMWVEVKKNNSFYKKGEVVMLAGKDDTHAFFHREEGEGRTFICVFKLEPLKVAVKTPTEEEYDRLMEVYGKVGWKWMSGCNALNVVNASTNWSDWKAKCHVLFRDSFFQSPTSRFLGYHLITVDEAIESLKLRFPNKLESNETVSESNPLPAPSPERKFKVGDRVKVSKEAGWHAGEIGTICFDDGSECVPYKIDVDGEDWYISAECLTLVEEDSYIGRNAGEDITWGRTILDEWQRVEPTHKTNNNNPSLMTKLSAWAKRNLSPTQKKLFKAGFINESGKPTLDGLTELEAINWDKNLAELEKSADETIKENKKK